MSKRNFILEADAYNLFHYDMYPSNTEYIYSYFESRTGTGDEMVFFGLQAFIRQYLEGIQITNADVDEADLFSRAATKKSLFNREGFKYIANECGGRLRLEIRALPEGTKIKRGNVVMTVVNTDPKLAWLTSFIGSHLTHIWNTCTIATQSYKLYRDIYKIYEDAGDNLDLVKSSVHCFGFRGCSSLETAASAGCGHLLSFISSDTLPAMKFALDHYSADPMHLVHTVPASEHSVMTSLGRDGEGDMVGRILDKHRLGVVSIVADSYNIYDFVKNIICGTYLHRIKRRFGTVVIRPDSGNPFEILPRLLAMLEESFGTTSNEHGLKLLSDKVRLMWGDGLDRDKIISILKNLVELGWAPSNVVYGMGAGLLQNVNRDTLKFAYKCSSQFRDGEWRDVAKEPLHSDKKSKKGRFAVVMRDNELCTIHIDELREDETNYLQLVFKDGELKRYQFFDSIRDILHKY